MRLATNLQKCLEQETSASRTITIIMSTTPANSSNNDNRRHSRSQLRASRRTMDQELVNNFYNGVPVNSRGQGREVRRAQHQLRHDHQLPEKREYIGFSRRAIVGAPGRANKGAFCGGKIDACRGILIPGQDEYGRREMAKRLGNALGFIDTVEYPTVKYLFGFAKTYSTVSPPRLKTPGV